MENNVLNLQFDGETLQIIGGEGAEAPEWINKNSNYEVNVAINPKDNNPIVYDCFNIVLSNPKNEKVLELQVAYLLKDGVYRGKFSFPSLLAGGTIVHLGIVAKEANKEEVVVSTPLKVQIRNSIATPNGFDLSSTELNTEGFLSFSKLITFFQAAKAVKEIKLVDITNENGQLEKNLAVTYIINDNTNPTTQYLGKVNSNLIDLGAQIKRKNNKGGGGKIGVGAELNGDQEGFAGGYKASACGGVAVGKEAAAVTGVAVGYKAVSASGDNKGIAIGYESYIDENSKSSIALGDHSKVINSHRSVAIGGVTITENERQTIVENSERSLSFGYNTKAENLKDGIAIGSGALSKGNVNSDRNQDGIAIGHIAKSALSGAIAIGTEATAGFKKADNLEIPSGNISDEPEHAFGGIAIGFRTLAGRGASIALGRNSKSYRWGATAIGTDSEAGYTNDEANTDYKLTAEKESDTEKNYGYCATAIGALTKAKGTRSVAIGYGSKTYNYSSVAIGNYAITKANGAVQLGHGTNTKATSLQFRDKTIVNSDQKLVVHLTKDSIKGALPIENGGTGATTGHEARTNLGFDCGYFEVTIKNSDVYEGDIKFNIPFKKEPIVVLTITDKNTSVPYRFTAMLDSCETNKFRYKVQMGPDYNGKAYKGNNKIGINWIAMSSYKG